MPRPLPEQVFTAGEGAQIGPNRRRQRENRGEIGLQRPSCRIPREAFCLLPSKRDTLRPLRAGGMPEGENLYFSCNYPLTNGKAGGKLQGGKGAVRSPSRSFSEASRKTFANQAYA